jgi:hypothetical protein
MKAKMAINTVRLPVPFLEKLKLISKRFSGSASG